MGRRLEVAVPINPLLGILVSIMCMALTIVIGAKVVLKPRRPPWQQAIVIAATANLLGKLFVSFLAWPAAASYGLPTLAFFVLSQVFFRPTFGKLIVYWLVGFAAYMAFHVVLSVAFGWTFMFPFWPVGR
jgi:hypothetical protein